MTSLQGRRVIAVHPSPDLYGSDRVFVDAVRAFAGAGANVDVVLPGAGRLEDLLANEDVRAHRVDFPILRKALLSPGPIAKLLWSTPSSLNRVAAFLKANRPDVVYVSTITIPHWLIAARATGIPSICHVHELESQLPGLVALGLLSPLALANGVIVNSLATRRFLEERLPRVGRRSILVYNGFRFNPPSHPAELTSPARLALVGRLSPRKGQDLAIEALSTVVEMGHNVTLELVGDTYTGYEWYERDLKAQVQRLGLADRVLFSGFSPNPDPVYAGSDIVLVPSRSEPFGNVAVEASAFGRPVIAATVGGLPEIVEDGVTGVLVPPDDAATLALAIHALLEAPKLAAHLGEQGALRVRERFSLERFAGDMVDVVATTIGNDITAPRVILKTPSDLS
jgi:glycosyltransferase involved in cell wall biosynthesis